jgi:hypothetical protein
VACAAAAGRSRRPAVLCPTTASARSKVQCSPEIDNVHFSSSSVAKARSSAKPDTYAPRVLGITAQTDNPVGDLRHIPALRWRYEARLKKHLNHNPKKESNPQKHCA